MITLLCLFWEESRLQLVGNNLLLGKHVNPGHSVRYASDTSDNDLFLYVLYKPWFTVIILELKYLPVMSVI